MEWYTYDIDRRKVLIASLKYKGFRKALFNVSQSIEVIGGAFLVIACGYVVTLLAFMIS